jgi:3-deoxy-D-manno-octulosonic-acid transferase
MIIIYNLSIWFYTLIINIVAIFNSKAKLWVKGRKNIFKYLKNNIASDAKTAWFHASSLGEFEQGRPVIEAFKKKYPHYKILLTFFSPSGYEVRKNYAEADYIFYLPADTKYNAKKFIDIVNPDVVFFIKYEFWYHYLNQLHKKNIPVYIFSAIFRRNQLFFKWYGSWYQNMLKLFTKLYVQNIESQQLLKSINITNTEIAGDTRFDRVYQLAKNVKKIDIIDKFTEDSTVIVAGSTWEKDEELLAQYVFYNKSIKLILAPHEVHKSHIEKICLLFKNDFVKFTEATNDNIFNKRVMIIDTIGILSSLYCYGQIAYIGGGFGKGIHNTLEAATYRIPVVFGPNYKRFQEACDLINLSAGFSISNFENLKLKFDNLLNNEKLLKSASNSAINYVNEMRGGTKLILAQLTLK